MSRFHDFRRHCAISLLQISKKTFRNIWFFVKIKLVSTVWVSTSLSKSGYCQSSSSVWIDLCGLSVAIVATIQGHNEISENLFDEDHHTDILAATQQTIMGSNSSWSRIVFWARIFKIIPFDDWWLICGFFTNRERDFFFQICRISRKISALQRVLNVKMNKESVVKFWLNWRNYALWIF